MKCQYLSIHTAWITWIFLLIRSLGRGLDGENSFFLTQSVFDQSISGFELTFYDMFFFSQIMRPSPKKTQRLTIEKNSFEFDFITEGHKWHSKADENRFFSSFFLLFWRELSRHSGWPIRKGPPHLTIALLMLQVDPWIFFI